MLVRQLACGGDRNFGYLVGDGRSGTCALIDPSPDPSPALREVESNRLEVVYLINTHGHYDHSAGNEQVKRATGARLVSHSSGADIRVNDGDSLPLGNLNLKFLYTPGHTPDSICVLVGNHLFTGDTLFVGKIGGTFGREDARVEFESLKRLMTLPDDITVWPGHDYGTKPRSTIGEEKASNPFCQRLGDFEAFFDLKLNWAEYKKKHGIQ